MLVLNSSQQNWKRKHVVWLCSSTCWSLCVSVWRPDATAGAAEQLLETRHSSTISEVRWFSSRVNLLCESSPAPSGNDAQTWQCDMMTVATGFTGTFKGSFMVLISKCMKKVFNGKVLSNKDLQATKVYRTFYGFSLWSDLSTNTMYVRVICLLDLWCFYACGSESVHSQKKRKKKKQGKKLSLRR